MVKREICYALTIKGIGILFFRLAIVIHHYDVTVV